MPTSLPQISAGEGGPSFRTATRDLPSALSSERRQVLLFLGENFDTFTLSAEKRPSKLTYVHQQPHSLRLVTLSAIIYSYSSLHTFIMDKTSNSKKSPGSEGSTGESERQSLLNRSKQIFGDKVELGKAPSKQWRNR
jgi:hypothetical protein